MKRITASDRVFDIINKLFVLTITLIIIYPLIYVISASISSPAAVATGKLWLYPVDITLDGFERVFKNKSLWLGYRNTIFYTILGTLIHLMVLLPSAYALSRDELIYKKAILWFILFTMLFSGGLIPTYLVVQSLNMLDTIWAVIIPNLVGAWSVLVARAFFEQNIPVELLDASKIDGASEFKIFLSIVLPLSMPIIAVMALFHAVSLWNQYFNALIYLSNNKLYPLQLILRQILVIGEAAMEAESGGDMEVMEQRVMEAAQIKYAVIIVSSLPLLLAYPFLQRYFVRGILIGSIK